MLINNALSVFLESLLPVTVPEYRARDPEWEDVRLQLGAFEIILF